MHTCWIRFNENGWNTSNLLPMRNENEKKKIKIASCGNLFDIGQVILEILTRKTNNRRNDVIKKLTEWCQRRHDAMIFNVTCVEYESRRLNFRRGFCSTPFANCDGFRKIVLCHLLPAAIFDGIVSFKLRRKWWITLWGFVTVEMRTGPTHDFNRKCLQIEKLNKLWWSIWDNAWFISRLSHCGAFFVGLRSVGRWGRIRKFLSGNGGCAREKFLLLLRFHIDEHCSVTRQITLIAAGHWMIHPPVHYCIWPFKRACLLWLNVSHLPLFRFERNDGPLSHELINDDSHFEEEKAKNCVFVLG